MAGEGGRWREMGGRWAGDGGRWAGVRLVGGLVKEIALVPRAPHRHPVELRGGSLLEVEVDERLAAQQVEEDGAQGPDVRRGRVARFLDHVALRVALGQGLGRRVLEGAPRLVSRGRGRGMLSAWLGAGVGLVLSAWLGAGVGLVLCAWLGAGVGACSPPARTREGSPRASRREAWLGFGFGFGISSCLAPRGLPSST